MEKTNGLIRHCTAFNHRWCFTGLSCLLIVVLLPAYSIAQTHSFSFSNLDKSRGLASNWCHVAFRDSRGYMWFGTQDGLSRYDGITMTNFLHVDQEAGTLAGNIVKDILEDRQGRIWIASNGGGLSCFDPVAEQFETYGHKTDNPNSAACETMVSLYLDDDEVLWIGNYDCGFHAFDIRKRTFRHFNLHQPTSSKQDAFKRNSVIDIIPDFSDREILWLAGNNGLYRFNKTDGKLTYFPSTYPGAENVGIFSLFMDHPEVIWMGTYGAGVARFNKSSGSWEHFFPDPIQWKKRNERANLVYSVKRKSANELWVCSQSEGFAVFDSRKSRFDFMKPDPEDPFSFGSREAYNVCPDRENLVWITTRTRGVFLLDPHFRFLHQQTLCPEGCESGNSPQDVTGFAWDDRKGKLYVVAKGTRDLFVFDKHFNLERRVPAGIPGENNSVIVGSRSEVWIGGTPSQGGSALLRYNPDQGKIVPFHPASSAGNSPEGFEINSLVEDSAKNIWAATSFGGIFKIDKVSGNTRQFIAQKENEQAPASFMKINQVIVSRTGDLWMATQDKGVYVLDPVQEHFKNFSHSFQQQTILTENMINTLLEDESGDIWVGTNATGINILDTENALFPERRTLQMKDGLSDDHILEMASDHQGNIWIYTISGLCVYKHASKEFIIFDEKCGFKGMHNWSMGLYTAAGNVFIGKKGGFYFFNADSLLKKSPAPPVVFTHFKIFEKTHNAGKNLNDTNQIVLRYNQNFFSVGFAALNFRNPEKNRYAYKLEGFNQDWVYTSPHQYVASFTNVPEGQYTFKVIAAGDNSDWNRNGASLKIIVHPPWYRTWWAYTLYAFLMLSVIYLIFRFQRRRYQLKTQLMIEQKEAEQLRELTQFRNRFYTNITHEFRTPLTVIMSLAAEIKGNEKYQRLIVRNGQRLLDLINQLLDLSKIEHSGLQLNWVKGDINQYLNYLVESLQYLAGAKKISLSYTSGVSSFIMDFDPERLRQIIYNLISNAVKFTPEYGTIAVNADVITKTDNSFLRIAVSDSGKGIDEHDQLRIFDPFYQAEQSDSTAHSSTGIGLALIAELVKLMEGSVSVNSKIGQGSTFTVILPVHDREVVTEKLTLPTLKSEINETPHTEPQGLVIGQPLLNRGFSEKPVLLLVEDNPDVVVYIEDILSENYTLEIAGDGLTGIKKAAEVVPDIIISDIMMPGADGLALCEKVKSDERTSHIPIILLTARASINDRIAGLERGADAYLSKPFHKKELEVEIRKLLVLREQLQARYSSLVSTPAVAERGNKKEVEFIKKVVEVISDNIAEENFGPEQLCRQLYISRSQLHRKLTALTGMSASRIIRTVKMEKAYEILQTGANVTEAADAVGFTDMSYFSKVFKETYGATPRDVKSH